MCIMPGHGNQESADGKSLPTEALRIAARRTSFVIGRPDTNVHIGEAALSRAEHEALALAAVLAVTPSKAAEMIVLDEADHSLGFRSERP
jgi:hypothetical protein